jgi:hypothetical protein
MHLPELLPGKSSHALHSSHQQTIVVDAAYLTPVDKTFAVWS